MNLHPFTIRNEKGRSIRRFGTYAEAEKAARKRCREKRETVPVFRYRTQFSTVIPCSDRGSFVFLTEKGSQLI